MTTDQQAADQANKPRKRMLFLIPLVITVAIFAWISSYIDDWSRDFTTNYAKTESEADNEMLRPLTVPFTPSKTTDLLETFAQQNQAWAVTETNDKPNETETVVQLTRTTGLIRYVDDVTVHLTPADDGSLVQIESQSRVGKGDLGQNPRNIIELNNWLSQQKNLGAE